ncbi:MAG: peptidase M23 [Gammaproteobacteria bacterium]|nr:peptidase M23 [Gammaproteobacteria bacterium]
MHRNIGIRLQGAVLACLLAWGLTVAAAASTTDNSLAQSVDAKNTAVPGGIYRWTPPAGATDIRFNNRPVMRLRDQILVGIPLNHPLGAANLAYVLSGEDASHSFSVVDKAYTEQHITLQNREMVNPNTEQLARIRRESRRQRALYLQHSDAPPPAAGFIQPLQGRISSLFGHRRFFNGQARNPHSGLDIAAPTGSEIRAPAAAEVTLVDDLYYNGKTIFLDHGQGLITMYCHLSESLVTEDERVEQGEVIGLVGATGRVTGPHLHWSVSLNGYRVDPQSIMAELTPE